MYVPSITLILSGIFIAFIANSIFTLSQLFIAPKCTGSPCFTSYLAKSPKLQLVLFVSPQPNPISSEVVKVLTINNFDYLEAYQKDIEIDIPPKTRGNGTLFLHSVLADNVGVVEWKHLKRDGPTIVQRLALTEYAVPQLASFNLLGDDPKDGKKQLHQPVTHFKRKAFITILTDSISMSQNDIPPELGHLLRANRHHEFLPIMQNDFLRTRLTDLVEVTKSSKKMTLSFHYAPIGIGKLRLILHVEHAMRSLKQLGFGKKDVDEIKGIFSDTNVYLLCATVFVGSVHVLFDFLSFKNDVSFWRRKQNYVGLSLRTTLWRAFSQIIVFLYLLDEKTSLLVLIPAGIATLIELWKSKKILKLEISFSGIRVRSVEESESLKIAESRTREVDREAMRYLSYLLYPLCACGAVYSLVYQPHKSWYSWTLNSLVNGVYAFGFLFMLPQLFINYKLKSVAALPWRAFMYKAFNTFIDDIFAFVITMPMAHRVACFRDDVVFLVYLYQRWLYPVDQSRIDHGTSIEESAELLSSEGTTVATPTTSENKKDK